MLLVIFYFVAGVVFAYFGYMRAGETVFNLPTILFSAIATWDFVMGFKQLKIVRDKQKENSDT